MIIDSKHSTANGINGHATSYLDPASARDVLKSYPRSDGLSLHELMDNSKVCLGTSGTMF